MRGLRPSSRRTAAAGLAGLASLALATSALALIGGPASASPGTASGRTPGSAAAPTGGVRGGHAVVARLVTPGLTPSAGAAAVPHPGLLPLHRQVPSGATARGSSAGSAAQPLTSIGRSWQGINDTGDWPTAPASAIGPTRYVEAVNSVIGDGYAVYDRTHDAPLYKGPLYDLTACADANCYNVSPTVIWDPTTHKFYYAAEEMPPAPGQVGHVMFGFSKSATPSDTNSWCHYEFGVGANLPDRPKLGDSKDFMIIGDNTYDGYSEKFVAAKMMAFAKPGGATLKTCPSSIRGGSSKALQGPSGNPVFAPTPANEIDPVSTGWLVARTFKLPSSSLVLFQVTRSSTGAPVFHTTGTLVNVGSYNKPAAAPQKGSKYKIDTGYAGPTQAVAALDPKHGHKNAIWTQQTIAGGAGSMVRWLEIYPAGHTLLQHGLVKSASGWLFNAAVSTDRVVAGSKRAFGAQMVLSYDSTSATAPTTAWVRSKIGSGPVSAPVKVQTSSGPDHGPDCSDDGTCTWAGGAMSPDPAAPVTAKTGVVWGVQMLTSSGGDQYTSTGVSWNFSVKP